MKKCGTFMKAKIKSKNALYKGIVLLNLLLVAVVTLVQDDNNYGFNLEKALNGHKIKELANAMLLLPF